MSYSFYFDETFHDRKIVLSENGTINTTRQDGLDDYVGIFWGCEQSKVDEYAKQLTDFEDKYRKLYDLPCGKEFKSEIIGRKNYRCGIQSFTKNALAFYNDLFQMLSNWSYVIHVSIISKIELLIRRALRGVIFPSFANKDAFIYSLAKLIVVHRPKQLIGAITSAANGGSSKEFRSVLLETLDAMIKASYGVPRKGRTIEAFEEMRYIIRSMVFTADFNEKTPFEYSIIYYGLENLLTELGIKAEDVTITIDEDEGTYNASKAFSFDSVQKGQSDNLIQLRLSDWLCGFIGRMLYALKNDENNREKALEDISKIDLDDIKKKRLLSSEWFDLRKRHFDIYLLLYRALIIQHEHYWTTLASVYSDDVICFYSLLRYFGSYKSFESFKEVSPELHAEYYNSHAIGAMENYYQKNKWR
ncbi:MAG: hypothetical protein IKH21_00200 [Clostridia bacterium]|nr:hypothetical protein [Clostridia bacterium]